jgi:hypothetical protein
MATTTSGPAERAATLALVAFLERELAPMMKRLGIPSRPALLRERRKLKSLIGEHADALEDKFSRQVARVDVVEFLGDLADCVRWRDFSPVEGVEGVDYYLIELRSLLRDALRRPLTKREITEMLQLQRNAQKEYDRELKRRQAQWRADAQKLFKRRKAA